MSTVQERPPHPALPGAEQAVDLCLANPWFYPVLVGPGERFRRYAPGLRRRGVFLRVVTVRHPGLAAEELVDGIHVRRIPIGTRARWQERTFVYRLLPELAAAARRPHVIQFFGYSPWNLPFLLLARLLRIRTVLVFTMLGDPEGGGLGARVRRRYRRWLFEGYDCVVTSSGVMTGELRALGVRRTRLETIPNGVDLQRFRPAQTGAERARLRRQLDLPPDAPLVLFVGSVLPRKGVDVLLRAWREIAAAHPRAHLLLVGPRHEDQPKFASFRDEVRQLAEASRAGDRITFTGPVENVEDYLRVADIFVFPSLREGMPNVVPEAMAAGVPVILTAFHGLPEEFGIASRHYRLVAREPEAIAAAVNDWLEHPEERRRVAAAARDWVEQTLDVELSIDRFGELFGQLTPQPISGKVVS